MATYRVIVPMIVAEIQVESGIGRRELYQGAIFDGAAVTPEHLEHLVSGKFVEKVTASDLDIEKQGAATAAAGDATRNKGGEGQTAYDDLTKEQLEELLRERELPVTGNKPELIARLVEADEAAPQS